MKLLLKGQEKSEFWSLLGGKTAYTDERVLKNVGESRIPRLFHGSNASGSFKSKSIGNRPLHTGANPSKRQMVHTSQFYFIWLDTNYQNHNKSNLEIIKSGSGNFLSFLFSCLFMNILILLGRNSKSRYGPFFYMTTQCVLVSWAL